MTTSKIKLPSRRQSFLLFASCAFSIYSWSILRYLWMIPGWEKYLGFWYMVTILAYALAFALLESLLVFLALVFLHAILPASIIRERFVSKGSALVVVNTLWAIVLHIVLLRDYILAWTFARYVLCATLYIASIAASWALVHRYGLVAEQIEAFVDRLTVLLYAYVPLSAFSVLVVITRNIF